MPIAVEAQGAGFEAGHVEQVRDEAVEALALFVDGLRKLASSFLAERLWLEQGACGPRDGGQGRAQVVRHRAQEGAAQPFALHGEASLLGLLGETDPLQARGRLLGEGLEKVI